MKVKQQLYESSTRECDDMRKFYKEVAKINNEKMTRPNLNILKENSISHLITYKLIQNYMKIYLWMLGKL